jgi:hypothetical protein
MPVSSGLYQAATVGAMAMSKVWGEAAIRVLLPRMDRRHLCALLRYRPSHPPQPEVRREAAPGVRSWSKLAIEQDDGANLTELESKLQQQPSSHADQQSSGVSIRILTFITDPFARVGPSRLLCPSFLGLDVPARRRSAGSTADTFLTYPATMALEPAQATEERG